MKNHQRDVPYGPRKDLHLQPEQSVGFAAKLPSTTRSNEDKVLQRTGESKREDLVPASHYFDRSNPGSRCGVPLT